MHAERRERPMRQSDPITEQDIKEFLKAQDALEESYAQARLERYEQQQEEHDEWRQQRYEERVQAEQEFRERRESNPLRWYIWYEELLEEVYLSFNPYPEYMSVDWSRSAGRCRLIPRDGVRLFREATFSQEAFDGNGSIFRLVLPSGEEEIFVAMKPRFESSWVEDPRIYEIEQIKGAQA